MKKQHLVAGIVSCAALLGLSAPALPQNPSGGDSSQAVSGRRFTIIERNNSATFKSAAPLEDFVGASSGLSGYIDFDPQSPRTGAGGSIALQVVSLETGIPLRDEHLQSADWLDAKNHPEISFTITQLSELAEVSVKDGATTYSVTLGGDFTLAGVTQPLQVTGTFIYLPASSASAAFGPGNLLIARAEFSVSLKDFNVPTAKFRKLLGSKVSEQIAVSVSFVASDEPEQK
ncbi:MAG TPA: YceI family protein [candidate division Zixibacteria bacterium]|nr:YceI family protein [candidate division Zixibacteria bacterium]